MIQQSQTEALGREPIGRLLFRLAAPAVAAQIINLLYNLVDRMYIGRIPDVGRIALTGVGVCLPLIMIISAFAALIGMGSAPRASIFLGGGEQEKAEHTLGNSVGALIVLSLLLTFVFCFFAEPMLLAFGASAETLPYGLSYLRIYALGTLFVQMTLGLNPFIGAQGFSRTAMLTVMLGAVCNIILDPILIFGFGMGVAGAAWATIISQCLSMLWILRFLCGKKTTIRIRKQYLRPQAKILLPCLALGLSPFIMQATESLIAICFNTSLQRYGGDIAVGAMTILISVMQFAMLPLSGLAQGAQPIVSYNYGARQAARVKKTFFYLLWSSLAYSLLLWAAVQLFPAFFVRIFNNDPTLIAFTTNALRVYMGVSFVLGAQLACQQTFIALGNAKSSLFLALLRKIFLLIPLIYLMPALFSGNQTMAVLLAEPVADLLAVTTTVLLFSFQFRKSLKALDAPSESEPLTKQTGPA